MKKVNIYSDTEKVNIYSSEKEVEELELEIKNINRKKLIILIVTLVVSVLIFALIKFYKNEQRKN